MVHGKLPYDFDPDSSRPKYRKGTRMLGVHFPEEIHRAFRVLAAKRGITTKAAMAEAIRDLLEKHNEPVPPALDNLQIRKRRRKAAQAIVG